MYCFFYFDGTTLTQHFFSTDVAKAALITAIASLLLTILLHFILPAKIRFIIMLTWITLSILIPVINHVRMLLAIRRHNSQMVDQANAQQLLVIFRWEKKVAADMALVTVVLVACLGPMLVVKLAIQHSFPRMYDLLYPWGFTMIYLNSSINPFLYLLRNGELRSAVRSSVPSCF